jgi:membrane-associated phospholipid phosphatase
VKTAPEPTRARRSGPGAARPGWTLAQFTLGAALLGLTALAGLVFVHRPWPNRLDVWGYRALPVDVSSRWAHDFVTIGSLTALVVGVSVVFVVGLMRDWVRAVACALAPLIAVLIVQDLAKPLVGRHLGLTGGSSFPSGTVAAVAALATAATLVVPGVVRPLVAVAGTVATVGTCAAVVVLRWHYPTDALGGIGVGVGSVLVLDALFHLPWAVAATLHPRHPGTDRTLRTEPRLA